MGMLDYLRNLVRRPSPTKTGGSDGVYAFGGHLIDTERRNELKGRNLYATFEQMLVECTIVAAATRYFQNLIGGTSVTITPREDAGADGERAADIVQHGLVEAQLGTMPFSAVVRKAALYKFYGFSAHEWAIRRRDDGMIVYADIQHRPQYTVDLWDMPEEGGRLEGFFQRVYGKPNYYYVDREQTFYCVDNTINDNPSGTGLFRHVVETARRLKLYEQWEGYGYQADLRGIPVAKVPGTQLQKLADGGKKPKGWVAAQTAAIDMLIANHAKTPMQGIVLDSEPFRDNAGNPIPLSMWSIELMKGDGSGLVEVNVVIERLVQEIARVLGMEWLLLGGNGKGSLALSRDKTSMFASLLEATLSELSWFATHDLVFPLLRFNGLDPEKCAPTFAFDSIATERVEAAVAALVGLAQAGAILTPTDPAVNQIRGRLHLADAEVPEIDYVQMGAPRVDIDGGDGPDTVDPNSVEPNAPGDGQSPAAAPSDKTAAPGEADHQPEPANGKVKKRRVQLRGDYGDRGDDDLLPMMLRALRKDSPDPGDVYVPGDIAARRRRKKPVARKLQMR